MERLQRHRELAIALTVAGLSLSALTALGVGGWPGQAFDCLHAPCYCERAGGGFFLQPGNTWSNLPAVVAGLGVASWLGRLRRDERALPGGVPVLGLLMPSVLVLQGVGSMAFHGTLTTWGSALDAMSMFGTMGLLLTTNLYRLGVVPERRIAPVWLAVMGGGFALGLVSVPAVTNLLFFMFLGILGAEVVLSRRGLAPSQGFLRAGLAVHVSSVTIWFLSAADGLPLCWPGSAWSGHGAWHVLEAVVVTLFTLHAVGNLRRVPPVTGPRGLSLGLA
jgi:hypothetical protein